MNSETLHPMVVHFPIALLLAALATETLGLALNTPSWHQISLWNLVVGTLGALAAVVTGGIASGVAEQVSAESLRVQQIHEVLGCLVLLLAALVSGWHMAAGEKMTRVQRWRAWWLLALTCAVTAAAGHFGGLLVYKFGVVCPQPLP